ncbi:MAG: undecaprenyldiphospho-muramoylpentapeptide beta-N-acetylglucosaminyltransferase [Gammaproteobacteria bacterium]|nr:undecaprenyldiphospho-muramoylpentapeptide beta-N-acetylglucosaminyltransferase [Gammaproteobacteria bacterium]
MNATDNNAAVNVTGAAGKTEAGDKTRVLIMAGGTGGHVFPALAVADELRSRGVDVVWLGTKRGLEAEVVPRADIKIFFINVSGLRGKGILGWLLAPIKLMYALWQGLAIIRRLKPAAVLGMGGFVTGPGGVAAWLLRKPLLIHEQNAVSGLTNQLLVPLATIVMEAFPDSIARGKAIHTGNPVRADIADLYDNSNTIVSNNLGGQLHLLVVGGSLGARALNEVVPKAFSLVKEKDRPEIWHQTGRKNINATNAIYHQCGVDARVVPFIENMAEAYHWADLVICRAGAMTVAELAIAGTASILVPYPFAVDDHQTVNANYLCRNNAAVLVQQSDLSAEKLREWFNSFNRETLQKMAQAARDLALPDATEIVANHCQAAANA